MKNAAMIISEARYAASIVTVQGDVYLFDDIGDLLQYDLEAEEQVHIYWVHDRNTEEWINAAKATFVLSPDLVTPMGWGLVAFTEQSDAEQFIAEHGGVVTTFAALQDEISDGSLSLSDFTGHDHGDADNDHDDHEDH